MRGRFLGRWTIEAVLSSRKWHAWLGSKQRRRAFVVARIRRSRDMKSSLHNVRCWNEGLLGLLATGITPKELMLSLLPVITLMMDAARVIEIRLRMMALGKSTPDEMFLMVSEKMSAMEKAKAIIISGGDPSLVIDNYQKIVTANVERLSDST
jgi:hypothetical protein